MKTDKKIIVIYHGPCSDGLGAAWVAWRKFGDEAEYIPAVHSDPPLDFEDKEIYFLDFVYEPEVLKKLVAQNKKVIALDHHFSTRDFLKYATDYRYGTDNSGSVVAWKYSFPDKLVPKLLRYIEDLDIWKQEMPSGREVFASIDRFERTFENFEKLARELDADEGLAEHIKIGGLLMAQSNKQIKEIIDGSAQLVVFEGYETLAVNSPLYTSDIGHHLCTTKPPIGIIWSQKKNLTTVSLRSNGEVDVAELAARYGGGGHKEAAAFRRKLNEPLPWKVLTNNK